MKNIIQTISTLSLLCMPKNASQRSNYEMTKGSTWRALFQEHHLIEIFPYWCSPPPTNDKYSQKMFNLFDYTLNKQYYLNLCSLFNQRTSRRFDSLPSVKESHSSFSNRSCFSLSTNLRHRLPKQYRRFLQSCLFI